MGIIWTIIIGLIAGVVAKFLVSGSKNEPSGFILTAILGIIARSAQLFWVKQLDGMNPVKAQASLGQSLVQ